MSSASSSAGEWYEPVLSNGRYIPLVVLGTISSSLSILGSGCIIYMSSRKVVRKLMDRILFGLSITDLISSTGFLITPFMIPSYLGLPGAIGTHASCTTVGFFFTAARAVGCAYNAHLSVYFLLVVRRNWKEDDFVKAQYWEIFGHIFAILIPIGISTVAAITKSINPAAVINQLCMYAQIPWHCKEEDTCLRSSEATVESLVLVFSAFRCLLTALSFICTLLVWWTVRSTIQRSNSYHFQPDQPIASAITTTSNSSNRHLAQVCKQCILYSLAYLNTFIWPFLAVLCTRFIDPTDLDAKKHDAGFYILQICFWMFAPLQGALNFFIYTRIQVSQWKKAHPKRSLFWIFKQILTFQVPPRTNQQSSLSPTAAARGAAPFLQDRSSPYQ